jgi:hypothetical protein
MFEDFCNLEDGCELNKEEMGGFLSPRICRLPSMFSCCSLVSSFRVDLG